MYEEPNEGTVSGKAMEPDPFCDAACPQIGLGSNESTIITLSQALLREIDSRHAEVLTRSAPRKTPLEDTVFSLKGHALCAGSLRALPWAR